MNEYTAIGPIDNPPLAFCRVLGKNEEDLIARGYAVLTSVTEQFLNSWPAVRIWKTRNPCHATFAYQTDVEIPTLPRGVWLNLIAPVHLIQLDEGSQLDLTAADCAGWVNLREPMPFRVSIKPGAEPRWWDQSLDLDERAHVLASLNEVANPVQLDERALRPQSD